jgi:hypothetical protein
MNAKAKIIGLAALMFCGLAVMFLHRSPPVDSTPPQPEAPAPAPRAEAPPVSVEPVLTVETLKELTRRSSPKPKSASAQNRGSAQNPNTPDEPLQDPDAREALALVGVDPVAEQYWLGAIFDSSLPDNEREDLMEDLNEAGFDDPKNPTADDFALIMARLQIIDFVLPNADDFMAEHLLEAQKDLVNMLGQVAQQ